MKIIGAYLSEGSQDTTTGMNILVWPDSAMIRTGKPVFIPDDDEEYQILPGIGVKIKAVGKTIQERFAGRYYDEVMPLAFILKNETAEDLAKRLDPKACDIVADCSVICGDPIPIKEIEAKPTVRVEFGIRSLQPEDGEEPVELKFDLSNLRLGLAHAIVRGSQDNTLKTGDIVAYILPMGLGTRVDNLVKFSLNGNPLLENKLK